MCRLFVFQCERYKQGVVPEVTQYKKQSKPMLRCDNVKGEIKDMNTYFKAFEKDKNI